MWKRNCEHCGSAFETDKKAQRYWSVECRRGAHLDKKRVRNRQYYQEKKWKPKPEPKKLDRTAGEINEEARKNGRTYGYEVALTEYPVKIQRKW